MRIDDEERHELAEALRRKAGGGEELYAIDLWDELDIDVEDGVIAPAGVRRLADLIDCSTIAAAR